MGKDKNKLETWGNETSMNLNPIVHQNVQSSSYFKSLYEKRTFHEVLQEVKNHVHNLEPFLKGRTASTAFCLLFKFWTLRLTVKQLMNLVECKDNTFVRALGFLYLRFVCKPQDLWEWFEPYLSDEEKVTTAGGPRPTVVTIGKLCRGLLLEQKFLNTMLPRIPVPVAREMERQLKMYDSGSYASETANPSYARAQSPDYGRYAASPDGRQNGRSRSPVAELDDFGRVRRASRSPVRRTSRSPVRRASRSPVRRASRSPARVRSHTSDSHGEDKGRRRTYSPERDRDRRHSDRHKMDNRSDYGRDRDYHGRSERDRDHEYRRHRDDRYRDDRYREDRYRDERSRDDRRRSDRHDHRDGSRGSRHHRSPEPHPANGTLRGGRASDNALEDGEMLDDRA